VLYLQAPEERPRATARFEVTRGDAQRPGRFGARIVDEAHGPAIHAAIVSAARATTGPRPDGDAGPAPDAAQRMHTRRER
jgi:hypothetical protein